MNLEVVIVDDERIGRQRLRRLLAKEPEVEVVAECADGSTAVEAVKEHAPDLLFLDIQMPGVDGFQVIDFIAPIAQPAIVFVTAFDKHAVHAFETCAVDYRGGWKLRDSTRRRPKSSSAGNDECARSAACGRRFSPCQP